MAPDLTDDDKAIIVKLLRETIERDRFPRSPQAPFAGLNLRALAN